MPDKKSRKTAHLSLDRLAADPRLAHLLPPEVAYRFHALPVAQDGGRVTVVMADPDDPEAVSAIAGVLGREPCVVQGDAATIDALLAGVWEADNRPGLRIRVCASGGEGADEIWRYARSLAALLGADVHGQPGAGLEQETGEDLLVTARPEGEPTPSWGGNVLIATQPRWPLHSILLVVGGSEADDQALRWVLRLAGPAGCQVTVLAVVPVLPPGTDPRSAEGVGLPALLSADTSLGSRLRQVAYQLAVQGVSSSIRVRQGSTEWQIRRELAERDHDLVVVGQQSDRRAGSRPEDEIVAASLRWSPRPTLIAGTAPDPSFK